MPRLIRRRTVLLCVGAVALLVGAQVAYWDWAAYRLARGVRGWADAWGRQGWRIETGPLSVTGWPNRVLVHLPALRIVHPDSGGGLAIEAPATTVSLSLWRPTCLLVHLGAAATIRVPDSAPWVLRSDRLTVTVPLVGETTTPVTVMGRGVRVQQDDGTWATAMAEVNGEAMAARTDRGEAAVRYAVDAKGIELPAETKWPLGSSIRAVSIDGTLNGPFPAFHTVTAWARGWRDGGGALDVRQAIMDWGPLKLVSSATLALDDQLQPMGSGNARVSGYDEALDRLATAGVLTRSAATVAKAMLSLLAGTDAETDAAGAGAGTEVEVPLSLQYRTLSMRQVPLLRLPELDWPAN